MDRDVKITLSLFLTWVVFGLNNLFGQPQAFVPPIIYDGLIIAGLGIYFMFPFKKNFFYLSIVVFSLFILVLSSIEIGWILLNDNWIILILILAFALSISLITATLLSYDRFNLLSIIGIVISTTFTLSFMYPIFPNLAINLPRPILLYLIGGICALIAIYMLTSEKKSNHEYKRILLLLFLNFIFDIGNYLALLALA